jgi:hypothetical protein
MRVGADELLTMTGGTIGGEEFERALSAVVNEMRSGFSAINGRLDRVNGRLDKHGEEIHERIRPKLAEHEFRLAQSVIVRGAATPEAPAVARGITFIVPTDSKTLAVILTTVGGVIAAAVAAYLGLS